MPALFVLFFVLVVAVVIYGFYARAQRRKALAAWAAANGLSYSQAHDGSFDERYGNFDCLREGSDRYAYNIMQGDWQGRPAVAFDYHYETYSRDSKGHRKTSHHRFSAAILHNSFPLKPLFIRPEGFFDKVTQFFGFDDIDFESAEFSRRFYVKSPDKRWAYDVIHPRTMELLLAGPRFSIKFDTGCVIAYRSSTFKPPEFAAAAGTIQGILDGLPDYLVRQQTGQG